MSRLKEDHHVLSADNTRWRVRYVREADRTADLVRVDEFGNSNWEDQITLPVSELRWVPASTRPPVEGIPNPRVLQSAVAVRHEKPVRRRAAAMGDRAPHVRALEKLRRVLYVGLCVSVCTGGVARGLSDRAKGTENMRRYLFVGEQRSNLAKAKGWTWTDGRLAAKQLFDALAANGIERSQCCFVNLFEADDEVLDVTPDITIVALGRKVQRELTRRNIEHIQMIHPAARGAIRLKARYAAQVKERLI